MGLVLQVEAGQEIRIKMPMPIDPLLEMKLERFDRQVLAICANSAIRLLFQLLLLFVGC